MSKLNHDGLRQAITRTHGKQVARHVTIITDEILTSCPPFSHQFAKSLNYLNRKGYTYCYERGTVSLIRE